MPLLRRFAPLALVVGALVVAGPAAADNPVVPKATTSAATSLTTSGATLAGTVDPQGSATSYVFEYGTSSAYGLTTPSADAGNGTGPVSAAATLSKLTSDTTYHFRVVATNAAGVTRGSDRTFRTARVTGSPSVTTGSAGSITTSSAVLTATVDARGLATTLHADYGLSSTYGQRSTDFVLPAGFGAKKISLPVAGLAPYATYHYRVVATNAKGTARGKDRTAVTLRAPTSIVLTSVPSVVGFGGSATIAGRVVGQGIGQIGLTVERQDFPFTAAPVRTNIATGNDAAFRTVVGPLGLTTRIRVVSRSTIVAVSPTVTVLNRLRADLRGVHRTRAKVTLAGTVQPTGKAVVTIQRRSRSGRTWVRVGRVPTTREDATTSRFRLRITRPRRASTYRAVAIAQDGGAHANGTTHKIRIAGRR